MSTPAIPLARPAPPPANPDNELWEQPRGQLAESVNGAIPYAERVMAPQSDDPNKSTYVPPAWGYTVQEAADALTNIFGGQSNRALLTLMKTIESELSPASSDGIAPCGYEEL